MSKSPKLDANQVAARVVKQTIEKHEQPLPADVEQAWQEWSRGIAKADARTMTLLKAAFEAGIEVGRKQG